MYNMYKCIYINIYIYIYIYIYMTYIEDLQKIRKEPKYN